MKEEVDLGNFNEPTKVSKKETGGNKLFEHPNLSEKELKNLKKHNYDEIKVKLDNVYVLKNKKNGRIVEIRGHSALHACNMLGWRFRHIMILSSYKISENKNAHVLKELNKIRSNKGTYLTRDMGSYHYAKNRVK